MHKVDQSGGFLSRLLGLTAAATTADAAIQKKTFGSGMAILIISNEELDDVLKTIKSLKESGLSMKNVSKAIKNRAKEEKGGFLARY